MPAGDMGEGLKLKFEKQGIICGCTEKVGAVTNDYIAAIPAIHAPESTCTVITDTGMAVTVIKTDKAVSCAMSRLF